MRSRATRRSRNPFSGHIFIPAAASASTTGSTQGSTHLPPAPGAGSTTSISSQGSPGMGTGHHAPFEARFRDKRAQMRLTKMTGLVGCYQCRCKKLLAATCVHPLPPGKGRAAEPCPCPGHHRHRSGALPRGLGCPGVGQGTPVTSARRRRPGARQARAQAEPRDRHR